MAMSIMLNRLRVTTISTARGRRESPPPYSVMPTDTSERGLERLICAAMTGLPCDPGSRETRNAGSGSAPTPSPAASEAREPRATYDPESNNGQATAPAGPAAPPATTTASTAWTWPSWRPSWPKPNPRRPRPPLRTRTAQPAASSWRASIARSASGGLSTFSATASGTVRAKSASTSGRLPRATRRPRRATTPNRFTVTRQLRYSRDESRLALDLALFVNGLPRRHVRAQEPADQADGGRRRCGSTSATATLARGCSSWGAAWPTLPWTSSRRGSALVFAARSRGSCPSTGGTAAVRAILRIRPAFALRICGKTCCRATAWPTSSKTMPRC